MAAPPSISLFAEKRVPFDETIADMRDDWTGATPLMEIRAEPGDSGAALVSLGASTAGSQGIALSYDADYPDPDGDPDLIGATLINILIDEATLEGLAYSADSSERLALYYDLHLTPSGGKKFVACAGSFTIDPGVTR